MAIADSVLHLYFNGKNNARDFDYLSEFTPVNGLEVFLQFKNTDGTVNTSLANYSGLTKIIVKNETVNTEFNLILTVNNGVDPVYTITLPVTDILIYTVSATFSAYITQIGVNTANITDIQVQIRGY